MSARTTRIVSTAVDGSPPVAFAIRPTASSTAEGRVAGESASIAATGAALPGAQAAYVPSCAPSLATAPAALDTAPTSKTQASTAIQRRRAIVSSLRLASRSIGDVAVVDIDPRL